MDLLNRAERDAPEREAPPVEVAEEDPDRRRPPPAGAGVDPADADVGFGAGAGAPRTSPTTRSEPGGSDRRLGDAQGPR